MLKYISTCTQGLKRLSVFALLFFHFPHDLMTRGSTLVCSIYSCFSISIWKRGIKVKCKVERKQQTSLGWAPSFHLVQLEIHKKNQRKGESRKLIDFFFFYFLPEECHSGISWHMWHRAALQNNMWTFTHKSDLHVEEIIPSPCLYL